jgi:NAD(P)-dependent dehydrogenase (short-subunit alcohol dehydrogenase family)
MGERPPRRVAIVTGAAQGIGFGIAQALARSGLKVALLDLDGAQAERSAGSLRAQDLDAIGLALDVTDARGWAQAVDAVTGRWGGLEVLVNNAGISPRGTLESTDEALWDRTLAVNLKGPWLGMKTALPWLRRSAGAIVNVGSTRATRPMRGMNSYCTSKAGLFGLTQQVAIEYVDDGVTCNMVAPGWTDTPGERLIQARHGRPDFPAGLRNMTSVDEVGAAVVYLVSEAGRAVNGTILYTDHGQHAADDRVMIYGGASAGPDIR